jgi:hypothetical protein cdifQCD_20081
MWNGSKYLIELKDDAVLDISTDKDYDKGCDTCDYYSTYTQEITFKLKNQDSFKISLEKKYKYPISEGKLIVLLADNRKIFKNMTAKEFKDFFFKLEDYLIAMSYRDGSDEDFNKEIVSFYQLSEG